MYDLFVFRIDINKLENNLCRQIYEEVELRVT